jgi:hypothetical protein
VKDLIRQFKHPDDSVLDAVVNVIANHAATITKLTDALEAAERRAFAAGVDAGHEFAQNGCVTTYDDWRASRETE